MTDPVAEAAAQIAAQAAEPTMLERAMETIHDLEAKVEHLIHPDAEVGTAAAGESVPNSSSPAPSADSAASSAMPMAIASAPTGSPVPIVGEPGNAPAVAEESVTEAATAEGAGGAAAGEAAPAGAATEPQSGDSSSTQPTSPDAESTTAEEIAAAEGKKSPGDAPTSPDGAATDAAGDVPNVASAVAAPTAEPASASSAAGASITSPTAASSAEPPNNPKMIAMDLSSDAPLHMKIAQHLESIYTLARDHVTAAPAAAVIDTSTLKTHVGDILHRISNGMAVTEGELVTKLEALYRML